MEMAKVTSKGQITIPISIRRRLSINEGDKLLFIDRPEGVMMVNPDMLGSSQETEVKAKAEPVTPIAVADESQTPEKAAIKSQPPQPSEIEESTIPYTPSETKKPAPDTTRKKSSATVGNLNLDAVLDEIRSIGRKI